jgi:predicted metal-dependent enzyme (double-stranded beta helix superfamily)
MHDAIENGAAIWTHRVLAAVAGNIGDGSPEEVAKLARVLARTPWWEGCPVATDALPDDAAPRYRRMPLRRPATAGDYSVLLIAWPPGHVTPIHDHDGLWGIELVLDGVLQVESFAMAMEPSLHLAARGAVPLGIGDYARFSDDDYAHRCRNLSAQRPALSLHVYGGALERFRTFDQDDRGRWDSVARCAELEPASY